VLLVNVGSSDARHDLALSFANDHFCVRVLLIPVPIAVSAACAAGCLRARGRRIFLSTLQLRNT
jgi:hypothetical protein